MRSARSWASAALLSVLASCEFTLYDPSSNAILDLQVRRHDGTPVAGAAFQVEVVDSAREMTVIDEPMGVTDDAGRFKRVMGVFLWPPFRGRVTLLVRPGAASGLPDSVVMGGVVQFRLDGEPPDTLRRVIVYP